MSCVKCNGTVIQIEEIALPKRIEEFICLNCGRRFWETEEESLSLTYNDAGTIKSVFDCLVLTN